MPRCGPARPDRPASGYQARQRAAGGHPAARAPRAATPPRRRASLRIFVVRCSLPCDPPVGGHSCNGGMIPRFHRAVCDYFTLRAPCGGADCLVKPRPPLSRLDRLLRAIFALLRLLLAIFAKTVFPASSMAVPA